MVSDSIANASVPIAAKDFPKKKRANRAAKLKQCKLDARREQWLSQAKNKGCKGEPDAIGEVDARNERGRSIENLEIMPREDMKVGSIHHYSDLDSPSNSPTSHTSSASGSTVSSTNFSGSSGDSSSGGSWSGSITGEEEEEEGDDECLDDWEAVADALAATNDKNDQHNPLDSPPESATQPSSAIVITCPKPECVENVQTGPPTGRAWKPDDTFRPQSLPNLSKQLSFPMNSGRHYGCGGVTWGLNNATSLPSLCPICCEDLDFTDSNFLPCLCGFRLCLFCHKRILEEDGRCPGCREPYKGGPIVEEATLDGGSLTLRLARSCSMITSCIVHRVDSWDNLDVEFEVILKDRSGDLEADFYDISAKHSLRW
ncbi:hypothetical protein Vadar_007824 [Vaccinium darrowii]|uniref:Uncharacterized protein n=1 Tax=Vaccinium darrowii TaxID=229202 RepID=A0ACB7ZJ41_9ERIC|nr:hypothetical protein Vadar_007824 [Vaccinium darrowii]